MRRTARRLAEVAGERADVRSTAAADLDMKIRTVTAKHPPFVHDDANRLEGQGLPATCRDVRARPANLLGGIRRRHLQEIPGEGGDGALDNRLLRRWCLREYVALEIVGRGAGPEAYGRAIQLRLGVEKWGQPGGTI